MSPKSLSDWQRAWIWARQHRRLAGTTGVAIVAVLGLTVSSFLTYHRTADALTMVSAERDAVAAERNQLRAAVEQKTEQLQKQEVHSQVQARERRALEENLRKLEAANQQMQKDCQTAEVRVKEAVRATRISMAEDLGRQAQRLHGELPNVSLFLAAKSLGITQKDGAPPNPAAFQQVQELLAPMGSTELRSHEGPVAQLATSRDGNWLASGDHQGAVRLWSTASVEAMKTSKLLDGHWGRITQLVFSADNRWLISSSTDSAIHLWNLEKTGSDAKPILLKNKQGRVTSLAVSDDGRWLAVAGASYAAAEVVVRLWDLQAADIAASVADLPPYQGELCSLAVNHSGSCVATGNKDGVVRLWRINTTSHSVMATDLRVQGEPVRSICFAPNGRTLISAASNESGKGTIQSWELEGSDDEDTTLSDCPRGVDAFALTSDGHWLFTIDQDAPLRVRNLTARDPKTSTVLAGQPCAVQSLAVSANDRWLAAAGIDNTVRLWYLGADGPAATPITIRPSQGLITGITFARRGDWLATASDRGLVQCWNLQVDELIRVANARGSR